MRYIKKKKSYNFSQEDFLRMAKYGVYCFADTEEVKDAPQQEEKETPQYETDVVNKGETLSQKANEWGSTVEEIASLNNIKDPDKVPAGLKINIPNNSKYIKYTYKEGDTGLARAKATGEEWDSYSKRNSHITQWDKIPVGGWTWELRNRVVANPQKVPVQTKTPQQNTQVSSVNQNNTEAPQAFNYDEYFKDVKPHELAKKHGMLRDFDANKKVEYPVVSEGDEWYGVDQNLNIMYNEMTKNPTRFFKATKSQLASIPRDFYTQNGFKRYIMPFIRQESNGMPNRIDLLSANNPGDWNEDKGKYWGLKKGGVFKTQLDALRTGIPMLITKGFSGSFVPLENSTKTARYIEPLHKVGVFWNGNNEMTADGKVFKNVYGDRVLNGFNSMNYFSPNYDSTIRRP